MNNFRKLNYVLLDKPAIISKISFLYWHFVDVMWFCVFIIVYFL